jgi:hypothetical protein
MQLVFLGTSGPTALDKRGHVTKTNNRAQRIHRFVLSAEDRAHIEAILAKHQPVRWPTRRESKWIRKHLEDIYPQVRTDVKALPDLDAEQRDRLRQRVGSTAARRYLLACFDFRSTIAYTIVVALVIAVFSLRAASGGPADRDHVVRVGLNDVGLFLICSKWLLLLLKPRVRTTLTRWEQRRSSVLGFVLAGATVPPILAVADLVQLYDRTNVDRHISLEVWFAPSAAFGVALFAGLVAAALCGDYKYAGVLEPLDLVFLQVFRIAVDIDVIRGRRRWLYRGYINFFNEALERAARSAERATRGRAPLTDFAARRNAALLGAQLAAIIRTHKSHLAVAIRPQEIDDVRSSLTAGILAWADRDLDALIANAPPVSLGRRVRSAARRVAPALLLAVAALALPMIPELASAASQIRLTLGISAILALVAGGVSAPDSIIDAVKQFEK